MHVLQKKLDDHERPTEGVEVRKCRNGVPLEAI
jgi:hypothetical protein